MTRARDEAARLRKLMADNLPLEHLWWEINDLRNRPTPEVTIEAILLSVRERGVAALKEPKNIERLRRCDAAALAQIDARLGKGNAR
jgi:hypothetical protein